MRNEELGVKNSLLILFIVRYNLFVY